MRRRSRRQCNGSTSVFYIKGARRMTMEKTVLIIDDSELVLAMAKDALEEAGYAVETATNGIEANRFIFSKNRPDLIIMDIMMPMLDGNKKAKILKENEMSKDIPILLLSSKGDDEMRKLTEEAGADGYILKPFSPIEITSRVRKCLSGGR
jgi:DNA-binding response OmpR family regulator